MTEKLKPSEDAKTSSAVTPAKNDTKPNEKASPTPSNTTSRIVDAYEEFSGKSIIIVGAPEPKK